MRLIHHPSQLPPSPGERSLAIGFFDGVHLGHQKVIRQAVADAHPPGAEAVVVTFDRHPKAVVAPDRRPALIYPLDLKIRTLATLQVPVILVFHFDAELSRRPGDTFIRDLVRDAGPIRSISVGRNFKFGYQRRGNVSLLEKLGQELHFTVHAHEAVSQDGEVVSSTRVRALIREGNLEAAGRMLGRPYVLAGRVVPGECLGRRLGFPTANLDTTGLILPPPGVYAVHAQAGDTIRRGVMNIGFRPTVAAAAPSARVEVHLLEFEGDLYGQTMEVTVGRKLRAEKRFPSTTALQEQIAHDIQAARAWFKVD